MSMATVIGALGGFVVGWIVSFFTLPTITRKLTGMPHPREVKRYIEGAKAMQRSRRAKHS